MRFYISDLHFYHDNLNRHMDERGFASLEEMHEYMIRRWNEKVRKNDEVVILGDFSIGTGPQTNEILEKLNGRKYLVTGNHDRYLKDKGFDAAHYEWIESYKELYDNKRKIIMSHYPIICYNGQYSMDEEDHPTTYMLYGHVHDSYDEVLVNELIHRTREHRRSIRGREGEIQIPCQMINCFCMYSDYQPLTLEEWIELDTKRREEMNEHIAGK